MPPLVPALLAALCVVTVPPTQCAETQQQQQPAAAGLFITPDELWKLIDRAVAAATQPLTIKLDSRIDTLDARLDTLIDSMLNKPEPRLDSLYSRLDSVDSRLDTLSAGPVALNSRLHVLDGRLDTVDSRLVILDSRLDVLDARVDGLTDHQHKHDSDLASVNAKLDNQSSRLDEKTKQLDSHTLELQEQESRLNSQESRLDTVTARLDSHDSRLGEQASRLGDQSSQIAGQASQIDDQKSQLDSHTFQIDSHESRLDGHKSQIDDQKLQLDVVVNKTDFQQAQIDGNTLRLNSLQTMSGRRDCSDLPAGSPSGVYLLQPGLDGSARVAAFCDLDTDGGNWTIIQRRADIQPRQDFYLHWAAYREGFGELDAEFWWGLNNMWMMTAGRDRQYELRINMEDFDGEKRHAVYQGFRISSEEDGYRLSATNYTGDAGDSLTYHVGQRFSTRDKDQDSSSSNCANNKHVKAGWWYKDCWRSNLNGRYLIGENTDQGGLAWYHWKGYHYSLKNVEMKIRPTEG